MIFLRVLLLWSVLASALHATTVQVASVQDYSEPAPMLPAVFGNHETGIDVDVHDATPASGPLMADLLQASGELALPLAANLRLQDSVTLKGGAPQRLHVSIKFPDVKAHTQLIVRLSLGGTTPLGDLRFDVFPASMTKELTDLLKPKPDGSVSVVLFGAGRKLHSFLNAIGVRFDDAGLHLPEEFEPNRIYFGEAKSPGELVATQEMTQTASVAFFQPDSTLPPGIYAGRRGTGAFAQVTLPLLDNLATDPRDQLALLKIIHFLNPQSTSVTPSSP